MDKQYIEENEIEIKYLRSQLTPDEVEEFEVYLMENPDSVEAVALEGLLVDHVGSHSIDDTINDSSFFSWALPFKAVLASLVPILVVALAINGAFVSNADLNVYAIRGQQTNLPSYNLSWAEQYLGFKSELSVHVFVDPQGQFLKASVEYFEPDREQYKAVETLSVIELTEEGEISIALPFTKLKPGDYRVVVTEILRTSNAVRATDNVSEVRDWVLRFKVE